MNHQNSSGNLDTDGRDTWPSHALDGGGEVYGPLATQRRAARVSELLGALSDALALACLVGPRQAVVLGGRIEVLAGMYEHLDARWVLPIARDDEHRVDAVFRRPLVEHLRAHGHATAADRIDNGPPDQPQPLGARLLALAILDEGELVVAVTWAGGAA